MKDYSINLFKKNIPALQKKLSSLAINYYPIFVIFFLVIIFYWVMILGFIIPSSDGAAGLAYYAYLYSSYVTYGKVMLWNVFGAGDVLAGYVLYALSPVDPVLNIWLFISKQLNLNILLSYLLALTNLPFFLSRY